MKPYRHELKYYLSHADYAVLSRRLKIAMDRDHFAQEDGNYFIRSLYFDDYQDSAFLDKMDGNDARDKYRIRIYNLRDDVIKLERKHKQGPYILKHSLSLSREECDALIAGDCLFLLQRREAFAKEMYVAFRTGALRPRVLVDYNREAYVFPYQDVRITFDKNIRTAYRSTALFDANAPTYPAADEYDLVMEIKFNEYLPGYIHTLVQPVINAQRSAISKYCLARKYE